MSIYVNILIFYYRYVSIKEYDHWISSLTRQNCNPSDTGGLLIDIIRIELNHMEIAFVVEDLPFQPLQTVADFIYMY